MRLLMPWVSKTLLVYDSLIPLICFCYCRKFFERTILCNSLVWSCAYTGHPGLTFQEALDSEQKAKEQLAAFPSNLKRPLLFVAALTHRSRLNDINDDVYFFAKDHFFLGETVDAVLANEK